ncbi:aminoglycoside phosphotransferase family protein [Gloeocapsopsis crepidinum LEGE 06123]|uniref:Aminoglycoside phosphotransferase family protein n=1 Tax=Gloeocapsopsis crepidinum LEGE 06123 TaxID=588587 RepID=A0ABR9UPR5_9CHRO|nr:aminoglycoside phosphotransferase family protein [Gloeocapsopsis crepidinum]MBE9190278.1 aminoglycoside phosphotransferase family protein [Gloeocapsopsis crepidinum LEGE 06123]
MLPADSSLIHRDAELSGLAVLLDVDALAAVLQAELPEINIQSIRSTYVRYKRGTNCLVAYELNVAGTKVPIYAKAFGANSWNKLQKFRNRTSVPGSLGIGRVILEAYGIAVCFFPNDKNLKQLPQLVDQRTRKHLLDKMSATDLCKTQLLNLRYKPERRYVGQLRTDTNIQAVLKAYTKEDFLQAKTNAQAFHSGTVLNVAPTLGYSDRDRLLAFKWIPQLPLHEAIAQPQFNYDTITLTGAALAEVHAQNPANLNILSRNAEAQSLLSIAADLSFIHPQIADLAQNLAQQFTEQLLSLPQLTIPIHGDFNAEQILLGENNVTFLDFDRAVRSDPAADLGSFVARLEYDKLRVNLPSYRLERIKEALLQSYQAPFLLNRIELYTAIALFRLACEPFRYREPNWDEKTVMILQQVETILQPLSTPQSA